MGRVAALLPVLAAGGEDAAAGNLVRPGHAAGYRGQNPGAPRRVHVGQAAHQAPGVRVRGPGVDLAGRRVLDHLPRIHHRDLVRHPGNHAQVVADVEGRGAVLLLELGDQVQDGRLDGDVQRGGRLVHDQERGVVEHGHRDQDALLLPARELERVPLHHAFHVGHVDPAQRLRALLVRFLALQPAVDDQRLGHLVADHHARVERRHRLLVDHRDVGPAQLAQLLLGAAAQLLAFEQDMPVRDKAVWPEEVHDREGHRALAAARLAHEAEVLALADVERDVPDRVDMPLARLVADRQVLD